MLIRPVYRPRMPSLAWGLIAWYPFDDTSAIDFSGNSNNGSKVSSPTPIGGMAPAVNGKQSLALKFNGSSSYVTSASFNAGGSRSYSLWFLASTLPAGVNVVALMDKRADVHNETAIYLNSSGQVRWLGYTDIGDTTHFDFTTTGTVVTGRWYHVAATTDSTTARLYLNGVLDTSTTTNVLPIFYRSGEPYYWGSEHASRFFNGNEDDIRVYNRAISPAEVLALYAEAFQSQIDIETIALMQKSQQSFLAAWAMQRNQISQGWAS